MSERKTPEEIEKLKADWKRDPIWDIEVTSGFEAHREELLAYRLECEAANRKAREEELKRIAEETRLAYEACGRREGPSMEHSPLEYWRWHMATQILPGLLAAQDPEELGYFPNEEAAAKAAVKQADALIAELQKEGGA